MTPKTAAAYARFSSDNQRAESISAQLADIRAYAQREGYTIVAEYTDEAKSATTDRRPEFQRMISDAGEGLFDTVLVFKLDRFSRDRYDFAFYRRQLKRNGVKIVSINEALSDDPESVILEAVLEGMAEYYSRNLSREVMRKGMIPNAQKCIFNGGTPPLGYDIDAEKHYILNPDEAETVRIIFRMYADGRGYSEIIDRLKSEGRASKKGATIGKSALYDILRNERYKGVYIYNVQAPKDVDGRRNRRKRKPDDEIIRIPGGVPKIVSEALWNAAQKRLDGAKKTSNKAKRVYILTGKIFCGKCGDAMVGRSTVTRGERYHYYDCGAKFRTRTCDMKSVRAETVEQIVVGKIYDEILSPESIDRFADMLIEYMQSRKQDLPDQIAEYERRLAETEKGIKSISDAILAGLYSPTMNAKMRELESQKAILEERIAEAEKEAAVTAAQKSEVLRYLTSFGDIRTADPHDQQKAVQTFCEGIYVYDDGTADIDIASPFRMESSPCHRHHPHAESNSILVLRIEIKKPR